MNQANENLGTGVELIRIQQDPISEGDLSPYRGMWVSIRERRVVGSAMSGEELQKAGHIAAGDNVQVIPTDESSIWIL